jgi:hypothetical protein
MMQGGGVGSKQHRRRASAQPQRGSAAAERGRARACVNESAVDDAAAYTQLMATSMHTTHERDESMEVRPVARDRGGRPPRCASAASAALSRLSVIASVGRSPHRRQCQIAIVSRSSSRQSTTCASGGRCVVGAVARGWWVRRCATPLAVRTHRSDRDERLGRQARAVAPRGDFNVEARTANTTPDALVANLARVVAGGVEARIRVVARRHGHVRCQRSEKAARSTGYQPTEHRKIGDPAGPPGWWCCWPSST